MSKLAGKVAVVTGASKGIGAGIAKALAAVGAAVVVNYASSKSGADAVVAQAAAKHLKEGGSIINIGSNASRLTPPGSAVYTGTKGAVDAITGVLARELGPRKIRVNSVNPGVVETEGTRGASIIGSDFEKWAIGQTPLGRIAQPEEIADVVVFLASNEARWLTGEIILASGGMR
jgi:3-oxoacyl-[acyl-carrier protein] reductase